MESRTEFEAQHLTSQKLARANATKATVWHPLATSFSRTEEDCLQKQRGVCSALCWSHRKNMWTEQILYVVSWCFRR